MAVAAEAPAKIGDEEVKQLMPILVVNGFESTEKIYLDDLTLYRLDAAVATGQ